MKKAPIFLILPILVAFMLTVTGYGAAESKKL